MEEKNMRELNMDEMDKVSGGAGGGTDVKDSVEYWMKGRSCPNCGQNSIRYFYLLWHSSGMAHIRCTPCCEEFKVYF